MYTHSAHKIQALDTSKSNELPGTCHELAAPAVETLITFPNRHERCSMSLFEFFALVIAPGNYIAICHKGQTGGMAQQFFPRSDIAGATGLIRWAVKKKRDVWYAVGSFREAHPDETDNKKLRGARTQANAQALRVLWYDADIHRPGDNKEPGKAFADEVR
jgi:hypothetical protein